METHDSDEIETASPSNNNPTNTILNQTSKGRIDTETSLRHWQSHIQQKFIIIIVDPKTNELEDTYRDFFTQLQRMVSSIQLFSEADQCLEFIMHIREEKLIFVLADYSNETFVSLISQMHQTDSIYMVMNEVPKPRPHMLEPRKIQLVCNDISTIVDRLQQYLQKYNRDVISTSVVSVHPGHELDKLDQSFMYSVLLREIILKMDYDAKAKKNFFKLCHDQYSTNQSVSNEVDEMEKNYDQHSPIRGYIEKPFIYSILNTALRTQDTASVIQMGFYLKDLQQQIEHVYSKNKPTQPLTVYRGQIMSSIDFNQMKESIGGLLSFNCFLSTTTDRQRALMFANVTNEDRQKTGLLFEIQINPNDAKIPYAPLALIPDCAEVEDEILFSMNTVFRIREIESISSILWHVTLESTTDTDHLLQLLTDRLREETQETNELHRLGNLLIKMGRFNEAQQIYCALLSTTPDEDSKERARVYNKLGNIFLEKGDFEMALSYFEKTGAIRLQSLSSDHPDLAATFNNIGLVYRNMGEYSKALSCYEKALVLREKVLPPNHPELASTYNNIGLVYYNMGDYSKALYFHERTLEIQQKTLPANHPVLATSYNNIGLVYDNMGEYLKALSFFEMTLEIRRRTLPANHPDSASSYNNIGLVYENIGEYSKALSFYERALEIRQKSLPQSHPALASIYNNIGSINQTMADYSAARSQFQKALEIQLKTLPSEHPDLATTYYNLGSTCRSMEDYQQALLYVEKSLTIGQKSLPENHPHVAAAYNTIGSIYISIGDFSKALTSFHKALDIFQQVLPANHPSLAEVYNNIGSIHSLMGNYVQAIPFFKKALIGQKISLPKNHPSLVITYKYIGRAHAALEHYANASSYYQDALKIQEKVLSSTHPSLAETYNDIGDMERVLGDCCAAHSYYTKALAIQKEMLPPNYPSLATTYSHLGQVYWSMKKYEPAISCLEKTIDIQVISLPSNHPSLALSHYTIARIFESSKEYDKSIKHARDAVRIITESVEPDPCQVRKYQEYLDNLRLNVGMEEIDKKEEKGNEETHLTLTILTSKEDSRLYSILTSFASNCLITPIQDNACIEILLSNSSVRNLILEVSSISLDELDRLLERVSIFDHIESIYVLGNPPENREERNKLLDRYGQVCVFCPDAEQIAVKWVLDTTNSCRLLGNQYSQSGDKETARKYFQRGMDLYNRLQKFIEMARH